MRRVGFLILSENSEAWVISCFGNAFGLTKLLFSLVNLTEKGRNQSNLKLLKHRYKNFGERKRVAYSLSAALFNLGFCFAFLCESLISHRLLWVSYFLKRNYCLEIRNVLYICQLKAGMSFLLLLPPMN